MVNNRIKIMLAIGAINLYMLSALVWWAFALVRFQERNYESQIEKLDLKKQLVEAKIENYLLLHQNVGLSKMLKTGKSGNTIGEVYKINKTMGICDSVKIKSIVNQEFKDFRVFFVTNRQRNYVEIGLSLREEIILEVNNTLLNKKKAWIYEGITLGIITLIIGGAMFVYVDKILRLNAQQNNFLLAVTHELKTPISAARLALQTVKKDTSLKLLPKMLEMANSNLLRLSNMVEQILMATRFESKFVDPVFSEKNISELIQEAIISLELTAERKGRLLTNTPDGIIGEVDEKMLKTVIKNLITNAFKYSEDESVVEIILTDSMSQYQIQVKDQGIGILDSDKKRVFEKFYRVGEEKTRSQPGSGLGLYLVKQITEMHGGKVSILDNKPQGTVFILKINKQQQTK
jgi:two-component system sensor histidine kinase CiaH